MAVGTQKLKKNVEGFMDYAGIFHPIRSGNKEQGELYSRELAGDDDDVFDKEIRKEKNQTKAQRIYEERQLKEALEDALGEESKISLSQFVRRAGGLKYDPKIKTNDSGELRNFSFKQSGVKGIAHPKGKKTFDQMRESADLAGYSTKDGLPLKTVSDFIDALDADLTGKKNYPFGTIGAYKFNPGQSQKGQPIANLKRVIMKLRKAKQSAKANKLEKVLKVAESLKKPAKAKVKAKVSPTKTKKRTTKKTVVRKTKTTAHRKNIEPITTLAEIALGTSAAIGIYDRLKKKKPTGPAKAMDFKENKGGNYQGQFEKLLNAIEAGDLSKQASAKRIGKLAGHTDNEVQRAIQYARLTYKLKHNPTAADHKAAADIVLKTNGLFGRALARHRAGSLYKRQLRLEAAIERTKGKRAKAEAKAKQNPASRNKKKVTRKNPVTSKAFEAFQGRKPTKVLELVTPEDAPKNLYTIGKLFELRLKGKSNLDFRRSVTGKTFYICADEKNRQVWIAGGAIAKPDSEIPKGRSEPYAQITHIVYETQKDHLGDNKPTGYIHEFGEEGGELPTLAFDRDGCGIIVGGDYSITPLGIAD